MDEPATFRYARKIVNPTVSTMAHNPGNVYRIPRRFNWPFVIGGFAFLSLAILLWGGGGTVEG
jgi:hypothetical protein